MPVHALVACLLLLPFSASAADAPHVDYQQIADAARWGFDQQPSDPLECATRNGDRYTIVLTSEARERYRVHIAIRDGAREAYAWDGHPLSVFRILGDRLYYARFHPSSDGGTIVAVDLTSGRELWATELVGLTPKPAHSAYQSAVRIDANDEAVTVWGNESYGTYLEFKDARTGATVGHRMFTLGYSDDRHEVPVVPKR